MNELTTYVNILNDIRRIIEDVRRQAYAAGQLEIANTRVRNLTWNHLRIIMREVTPEGRPWYMKEASAA